VSPSKDQNGLTPSEALEHQLKNNILVQNQETKYITPSSPFLYLGVTLTMDLNWKHRHRRMDETLKHQLKNNMRVQNQATKYITPRSPFLYLGVTLTMDLNWKHRHRRMDETLKQKLDALEGSYASPRQTLNIIRTAIIPSLAYAFAVTPCSYPDLDKWDAMIGRVIKSKHNLWRSTLTAMIREDVHTFGLGAPSIYVKYHRRSAVALVTRLEDPFKPICDHASPDPPGRPTQGPCRFIPFRRRRSVTTKKMATQPACASTSTCLHPSQQAPLSLKRKQHVLDDLKLISEVTSARKPPPPQH
jgi:ligand-binding SRPBCC domain-containing protein